MTPSEAARRTGALSPEVLTAVLALARHADPGLVAIRAGYVITEDGWRDIQAVRVLVMATGPFLSFGVLMPMPRAILIETDRYEKPDVQAAIAEAEAKGLHVEAVTYDHTHPRTPGISVVVWGRIAGTGEAAHIDELDTVQRMGCLGPLTRTPPHEDGYWWEVRRDEKIRWLSAQMFVGEGELGGPLASGRGGE